MPANTSPIFTLTPVVAKLNLTGNIANTTSDGVGTIGSNIFRLVTGNTNGTFISKIRFHFYGTAAALATAATVIRIYESTQASGATIATNTFLIREFSVGILTAASATVALTPIEVPLNWAIQASDNILISVSTNFAANTGCQVLAFSGDY